MGKRLVIWKDIKGYETLYQVSNTGLVKSIPRRMRYKNKKVVGGFRKLQTTHQGYKQVSLNKDGISKKFLVHRLVGEAHVPNIYNKPNINHKDGDKSNNHSSNLEWVTSSENRKHAYDNGFIKPPYLGKKGKYHNRSKTIYRLSKWGDVIAIYHGSHEAGRKLGISYKLIARVASGERKSTHGMYFIYRDKLLKAEPKISEVWEKD